MFRITLAASSLLLLAGTAAQAQTSTQPGTYQVITRATFAGAWPLTTAFGVNEAWSTQMCSSCGRVEGPKGLEQLDVREWTCSCGAHHDRDVNAALNIRAKGLAQMAISKAAEAKANETVLNKDSGALCSMAEAGHGLPAGGITVVAVRMSRRAGRALG